MTFRPEATASYISVENVKGDKIVSCKFNFIFMYAVSFQDNNSFTQKKGNCILFILNSIHFRKILWSYVDIK